MSVSTKIIVYFVACSGFICVYETARPVDKKISTITSDRVVYPGDFSYRYNAQQQNYQYNNRKYEDYNDGLGPKPSTSTYAYNENAKLWDVRNVTNNIPVSFIKEINDKGFAVNDLLLHYVDDYEDDFIESRFGEERAGVTLAKEAKCMPELRTVNLIENKDSSVLYIPSCTRIERCGGCCMHELLECQPKEVETINIKVIKVIYTGGKNLKYAEKEIVSVDKHKSCKCDCKVRAENCTSMQVYEKNECKCSCRNTDEEKKCQKENSTKLWNPNACACQCRDELMCTTGSVFDWRECKCVITQMKRRNAEQQKKLDYSNVPMSVIPLSDEEF